MNKILQLTLLLTILVSCKAELQRENDFGIKGDFKKLIIINYRTKKDSLGKSIKDTISIVNYKVNKRGKVKKSVTQLFSHNKIIDTVTSKYLYNSIGQTIKEITDTKSNKTNFEINYYYKNELLDVIKMRDTLEGFILELTENYSYDANDKLKLRESNQLAYNQIKKDTFSFQKVIFKYDKNEFQIESDWNELFSDFPNLKEYYKNDSLGLLQETISFNKLTKKTDTIIYIYKYDINNNWINSKSFKNNTLDQITDRVIEY